MQVVPLRKIRVAVNCATAASPEDFLGSSRAFVEAVRQAMIVAPLSVDVLLTGASGTGKTKLARMIHAASERADRPFVELNCAALPESLIENELFGSAAGAHSTARVAAAGKLAAAAGGTLFLDEIGELPLGAQAKLLQFLQSRHYYPLGSTQLCEADVRVVSASNADLQRAVTERRFREDLMYRLQVFPIRLPSLSERPEDIHELAESFCQRASARHGLPVVHLTAAAADALVSASWPGNVRQLEHAVEAGVIRAATSGVSHVSPSHIFPDLLEAIIGPPVRQERFREATRSFQAALIRRVLTDCDGNVAECARELGLARSHLYTLMRELGLRGRELDSARVTGSPRATAPSVLSAEPREQREGQPQPS